MKRQWTILELNEQWTLSPAERVLVDEGRDAHTRLGCACFLKYFLLEWRFPHGRADVPIPVIAHLAQQLGIPATSFLAYDWDGRMAKYHRAAIRAFLGVREATVGDQQQVTDWLVTHVLPQSPQPEALRSAFIDRCRALGLEPPTPDRVERHLRTASAAYHDQVCAATLAALSPATRAKLDDLLTVTAALAATESQPEVSGRSALAELRLDPGPFSVATVEEEAAKLARIRGLGLPPDLFRAVSPPVLAGFRRRVAAEELHELRRHPMARRLTLLAAYCWVRAQELTDALTEILTGIIQHIGVRAERRVERALIRVIKRVTGKPTLLFDIAAAALARPDDTVRAVIFPLAGEQTLHDLVKEAKASGPAYQRTVYTFMRTSYAAHYRRMVPILLGALEFRSNNAQHRPTIEALALLKQHVTLPRTQPSVPLTDAVPITGVVRSRWRDLVIQRDKDGTERVNRINYEIAVLHAVRDKLRCKEVWVDGADRFRNPDDDLPADFTARRETYYAALHLPMAAADFVASIKQRLTSALEALNADIPTNPHVRLLPKRGGWIALSPLEPQPEPVNLGRLKTEIGRRWPMTSLLDMLKEADLRVGLTELFTSATPREHLDRETLQKRLLLCLYGLGTNIGLRRVSAGDHGEQARDLYYTRRRYITRDHLRVAIARVVDAIFATRRPDIWGEATTACASDAKKFGAFDQNLLTEWHPRYRGPGVMVYWHMDKKAACIYSQLKSPTSSEVAAMIEGVLRHCTEMQVDRQFVDSHGQSEVAFTCCNLLGFRLLPRLKAIHQQKLYRPEAGQPDAYPHLQPVLTRSINWELIRQQYDEIIKHVTALRLGTADAEAILRRFTRGNVQHPTYRAMAELGKAYKTIFLSEYLREPALRREIHEGLNVVENWNSANSFIFYGRSGEIATNQREDAEVSMLCLHLLQAALTFVNTLLIQRVLADPAWMERLTVEDLRALTPLIYANVNPYGEIRLDMTRRLPIGDEAVA
jgi:TnpA family transposase